MAFALRMTIALFLSLTSSFANAAVLEKSVTGFSLSVSTEVPGQPADAYSAFLKIGSWWSSEHSFSGDAKNFYIEAKPGGCMCETLPNGGFVRHSEVIRVIPGETLVLSGGRGPLQTMGVSAAMTVSFKASGNGTTVVIDYAVGGHDKDNFETLADAVDRVMTLQLTRFTSFVKTGKP